MAGTFLVGQATHLLLNHAQKGEVRGFVLDMSPREVILSFPSLSAPPPGFLPGRNVTVRFWSDLGVHNATSAILRYGQGPQVRIVIERFQKFDTVQQRRYFRVIAALSVSFQVVASSLAEAQGKAGIKAVTRDISAGGLSMSAPLRLAKGDRLRLAVSPPRSLAKTLPATLNADAEVVRVQETKHTTKTVISVGVDYRFPAEIERDRWVQLTFHLQRGVKY